MNKNLIPIYGKLKGIVDNILFRKLLSETVAIGIEAFAMLKKDLNATSEIDYAEILVESYGNEILEKRNVIEFLIMKCLSKEEIDELCEVLFIQNDLGDFSKRKTIVEASTPSLRQILIELFKLDPEYFKKAKEKPNFNEVIKPFTPIPSIDNQLIEEIPREYLSLHEYQKRVKDKLLKKLVYEPEAKVLVHMPTGSGKTKTTVETIIDFIKLKFLIPHESGTVLWFAHSKELCEQAYDTFKNLWLFKGDYPINMFKFFGNSSNDDLFECTKTHSSIIFIGFQKFDNLLKAKADKNKLHAIKQFFIENAKLVIIDEAHKALANTYEHALEFVTQTKGCRLVGLTATPGRSNYFTGDNENNDLAQKFDNNIIRITDKNDGILKNPLTFLQDIKVLARLEQEELPVSIDFTQFDYENSDYLKVEKSNDITSKEIGIISINPHRNSIIIDKIIENKDLSTLVFACSKEHCMILNGILRSFYKVQAKTILGDTDKANRKVAIDEFKNKELNILINYGVLSTGFDAPKLNTLILARPTKSVVLYSQIVGRVLRGPANGGNELNKLITIKDNLIGFPDPEFMFSYWEEFWN